jgi:hypothetical protein
MGGLQTKGGSMSTKTAIRRLVLTATLALAALGAMPAGSGASAGKAVVCHAPAQACLTDAEFRALTIRSVALNRKYGLGE